MPPPIVSFEKVSFSYNRALVLHDLSFTLNQGEIVGLLGPNGAGKTTTIKLIAGILAPAAGAVSVCGFPVPEQAVSVKQRIGYVPEAGALFDSLTGQEFLVFFICAFLPYGNDFKAAWVFLLAPAQAFGGFARGIYAALWIRVIVVPHAIMFLLFAWPWGLWRAGLFTGYSAAAASVYLALELRIIDCVPFSRQLDPARTAVSMALVLAGAPVTAIAVGVQHFLVFRSPGTVAAVTVVLAAAAYSLTRSSLGALESSMRYNLGLLSEEAGMLYREVNV